MRTSRAAAAGLFALSALACGEKPPTITAFAADQASVISGGRATLSWQTDGAQSLTLDPGGISVSGRQSIAVTPTAAALPATVTYTLTAQSGGAKATATASLLVTDAPATLTSFTASPSWSQPDQPVTLSWTARNAASLVLTADVAPGVPLPTLRPSDTQATVTPHSTTVYTLTATGPAATASPAPLTARARVAVLPTVSLSASPLSSLSPGSTVLLSWTSTDAEEFTLLATPAGAATPVAATPLGAATSVKVRPLASTDYAVQALGPGGAARSATLTVPVSGPAATALSFSPTAPASGDVLQVVAAASPSPPGSLTLEVRTLVALNLAAVALDLPLDGGTDSATVVRSRDGSARVQLDTAAPAAVDGLFQSVSGNAFEVSVAALNPGSAPFSAAAALPATGPLAGVVTLGAARKPACTALACAGGGSGEAAVAANTVIARLHLALSPGAGPGTVFAPGDLQAVNGYRAVVRNAAGASLGTVALGTLAAIP